MAYKNNNLQSSNLLLIERKNGPFKGCWAIPGGYVNAKETLEQAAYRELQEETSLSKDDLKGGDFGLLKQFKTYGDPGRDPRGRIISVVYFDFFEDSSKFRKLVKASDDAKNAQWFSFKRIPKMAFDHAIILEDFKKFWNIK